MSQHAPEPLRKPRTDDRPLWDVVFGVYGYPAILLAHKLKLFPLLAEHPRPLQEVAETLKIARRPAEALSSAHAEELCEFGSRGSPDTARAPLQ